MPFLEASSKFFKSIVSSVDYDYYLDISAGTMANLVAAAFGKEKPENPSYRCTETLRSFFAENSSIWPVTPGTK